MVYTKNSFQSTVMLLSKAVYVSAVSPQKQSGVTRLDTDGTKSVISDREAKLAAYSSVYNKPDSSVRVDRSMVCTLVLSTVTP